MSDDDTQTLEVYIEHPPTRGSTEKIQVPEGISREEAEEWARNVFWNICNYGFNAEDFEPEDGGGEDE